VNKNTTFREMIKISPHGKIRVYIDKALELLDDQDTLKICARDASITKAITVAEIVKRRKPKISTSSIRILNDTVLDGNGNVDDLPLDSLVVSRKIPCIQITLAKTAK
jgi:DNA-binding protein